MSGGREDALQAAFAAMEDLVKSSARGTAEGVGYEFPQRSTG